MYKVIDLGSSFPGTGEPRVRMLDSGLTKTASTEIRRFWDGIEKEDGSAYLWVIGVSAMEYYGCNNNGDAFTEEDLRRRHTDFTKSAHIFMHHVNKDPAKSIGRPVFSWYNDAMHRIELILRIDGSMPGADAVIERIKSGEQMYVSMGTTVSYDVCSICGNKAKTRADYCDHLRYNMRKILPDGRQVYALNPDPHFFDISIVSRPADPTAFALDKIASYGGPQADGFVSSAELGEQAELTAEKLASLDKLSDIIKHVDGEVVDTKGEYRVARALRERGFSDMEWPETPHVKLRIMRVSPAGLASVMHGLGAPLTFGDALWLGGRHAFGRSFGEEHMPEVLDALPHAIRMLRENIGGMDGIFREVMSDYDGELDSPVHRGFVMRMLKPEAEIRIRIMRKTAAEHESRTQHEYDAGSLFATGGSNLAPIRLSDGTRTAPFLLQQHASRGLSVSKALGAALGAAAVAGILSSSKLSDKVATGIVLGIPAFSLFTSAGSKDADVERDVMRLGPAEKTAALRAGTLAGALLPGALAADYAFNRSRYDSDSALAKAESCAASAMYEAPVATTLLGATLGSLIPIGKR